MENQTGLADRARFEAFSRQWRDAALKEAGKWCADENAKQLLADAVFAELRRKYADSDPPFAMEYFLRAQVCAVYSQTGQNRRRLEGYIAERAFPEPPDAAPQAAAAAQAEPPTPAPVQAETLIPPQETAPVIVQATIPAPVSVQPTVPAPVPVPAQEAAPATPAVPVPVPGAPEKTAEAKPAPKLSVPDTYLDPARTTLWTPDEERSEHIVQEIELPDEEESERSVAISFLNTILFLLTVGAFSFCFYETGFLQYLLQ